MHCVGCRYSVYDLSVAVAEAMGVPHNVKLLDKRNEVEYAYASHEKLRCFFNPPPTVSLREGLARTAAYAKALGKFTPSTATTILSNPGPGARGKRHRIMPVYQISHCAGGFMDIEIWEKMPPSWVQALRSWKAASKDRSKRSASAGGKLHAPHTQ